MNNFISKLIVCLSIFSSTLSHAEKTFRVAPGRVEVNLNKPVTKPILVFNDGDEEIILDVKVGFIPLGKNGINIGEHNKEKVSEIENIEDYIRVAPRVVRLSPGEKREVKINVNNNYSIKGNKPKKANGDYRAHVFITTKERSARTMNLNTKKDDYNVKIKLKIETAIAIYGRIGKEIYQNSNGLGEGIDITCNNKEITFDNKTNYKHTFTYKKKGISDVVINDYIVMRNSVRTIPYQKSNSGNPIEFIINNEKKKLVKCS